MLPQDRVGGQGQRPRALPDVPCEGGGSSGDAVTGAGAATTAAGFGLLFLAGCGGGAGRSGELASVPASVGGLSSGFAEASAAGAS